MGENKKYKFSYKSIKELEKDISQLEVKLPVNKDLNIFNKDVKVGSGKIIHNKLAIHPMEGTDANSDGSPGELTKRRYIRFAQGGAALIWFEAAAINEQGRANEFQLFLNNRTVDSFSKLINQVRRTAQDKYGKNPYLVLQLSHSGRFGEHKTIMFHEKNIDKISGVNNDLPVITDRELEDLEDDFLKTAYLAREAGFDAVDIKSCHRYLLSEMLASHTRKGKYGGSYENRTRFIKNVIRKIKEKLDIDLAIRINMFDSIPYPYGWGTDKDSNIDLSEPKKFVGELADLGMNIFNVTAGTPYLEPHINRPYNTPGKNGYQAPEHPLVGVNRLVYLGKVIKKEVKDCLVIGTGFSWLRQFAPYIGSGILNKGWADIIGFGREAFAYPDFAYDIIYNNGFDSNKICLTCGKCTDLKANNKFTGCAVRDRKIYSQY